MTAPVLAVQAALWQVCDHLLMHHTNPWELDEALKSAEFEIGPCEVQDHIGLMQVLARKDAPSTPILPRMVAEGRLGKISGVGFYRYPGGGGAVVDPLIEDLILEEAHFCKVTRVALSDIALVTQVRQVVRTAIAVHKADTHEVARQLHIPVPILTAI